MEEIKEIKENYMQFNMEQILPVLIELKLAKNVTEEFISILKNYRESLYEITQQISNTNNLIKISEFVLNQIKSIINKQNPLKKIGSKKDTIYERLCRGLLYRYKIKNNVLAENPEYFTIEKLIISPLTNIIIIGNSEFQIFNFESRSNKKEDNQNNSISKDINLNIINIQIIIAELDIILMQINNFINIINDDVIHFGLFDEKYLSI
jgi:hypothetical protein